MSGKEIAAVSQRYRKRVEAVLTPDELARFDAYQQRVQAAIAQRDTAPIALTTDEQAVLDKIAADTQAAALHKQLDVLLRIEMPAQ